jgi:hypothetical protein
MNDVDELLQVEPKLTPLLIGRGTKRTASQNRIAIKVRDKLMSRVPSRIVLELVDAISGISRVPS